MNNNLCSVCFEAIEIFAKEGICEGIRYQICKGCGLEEIDSLEEGE